MYHKPNKKLRVHKPIASLLAILILIFLASAWAQPASYNEAPQLAQLVAAGQLPPVEERLPTNPMVVPVHEEIGQYGGVWRMAMVGGADGGMIDVATAHENLVRWAPDYNSIIPNIAESYDINEDATEYIFYLREGMRWSDGHPFTADDIMFWYEDVFMNSELTPSRPALYVRGGEPVVVEKIDDYTVSFQFAAPNALFLHGLAQVSGTYPTGHPKHYFSQLHPTYNENVDQLVAEAGAADWVALFQARGGGWPGYDRFSNIDIPVLYPWKLTRALGDTTLVVAERNPYYWKVDPEGNQLPYINRVTWDQLSDPEVLVLKVLAGEIDFQHRHLARPVNKPVFIDNMERGDYRLIDMIPTTVNATVIMLNLNHPDPQMREIFHNRDFRAGLSHAINRQELIDLIWVGQGEPHQAAPRPDSDFYHERLAKQHTEYDVALANEYLDRAGYSQRDAQGYRLGPDGNRITFFAEVSLAEPEIVAAMELVEQYWQDVGVDMQFRAIDRSLWETRIRGGSLDWDVTAHRWGGGSGLEVIVDPRYWFPFSNDSIYARAWASWFMGGGAVPPEEPPLEVQQQMDLYRQVQATGDPEQQAELMWQILDMAVDQFYAIGIKTEANSFGVLKNRMRNVPEVMFDSFRWPAPAPTNPEQYFWDN